MKTILLLLITSITFAQNCKYGRNEIDAFTKEKVLETKETRLFQSPDFYAGFSAVKINEKTYFNIHFSMLKVFSLYKNDAFILLTDSGEIIEFKIPESRVSNRKGYYGGYGQVTFFIDELFEIKQTTISKLQSVTVSKVRAYIPDGYIDSDVKPKDWIKIRESFNCIK